MSGFYTPVLDGHRRAVEKALPEFLPVGTPPQAAVVQAMRYACSEGGKRLRPVLTLEFCRLCCGEAERAMPFAAAVEMVHSYSLVHDDMPCMDDSPLRRGKPSVHAAFGEDMALLAGDGLLNLAFETMLNPAGWPDVPAGRVLSAAYALARAAGIYGMVGGQAIDLESEGRAIDLDRLRVLQEGKTAALMAAACEAGCIIGGGEEAQADAARRYGLHIGLCFQMIDDILDVTATSEQLGKPVGSDASNEKTTYVSLLGLDGTQRLAREHTESAIEALAAFPQDTEDLRLLANRLLNRTR